MMFEGLTLKGHSGPVLAVAIPVDRTYLVSGGQDGTCQVWNPSSGERIVKHEFGSAVTSIVLPDNEYFVSGHANGEIHLSRTPTGQLIAKLRKGDSPITQLAVSTDRRWLLSASRRNAHSWNLSSHTHARKLGSLFRDTHNGFVTAVALSSDGKLALTGSDYGEIKVWDTDHGRVLHVFQLSQSIMALSFIRNASCVIVWTELAAYLIDANSWIQPKRFDHAAGRCTAIAVSDYSNRIVVADEHNGCFWVRLLNLETGEQVASHGEHTQKIRAVAISDDGARIASASVDGTIRVWKCRITT